MKMRVLAGSILIAIWLYPISKIQSKKDSATPESTVEKLVETPVSGSLLAQADYFLPEPSCTPFWEEIEKLPVKLGFNSGTGILQGNLAAGETLASKLVATGVKCSMGQKHPLKEIHEIVANSCRMASVDCLKDLISYRLKLIDWRSDKLSLSQISDLNLLSTKLFSQIISNTPNYEKMGRIADRMLELNPENPLAQKYGLVASSAFANEILESKDSSSAASSLKVQELQARMENLIQTINPKEGAAEKLLAAKLMLARLQREPRVMDKLAEDFAALPDASTGSVSHYYHAWAAYLEGDLPQAKQQLALVSANDDAYVQAQTSLESLSRPEHAFFQDPLNRISYGISWDQGE